MEIKDLKSRLKNKEHRIKEAVTKVSEWSIHNFPHPATKENLKLRRKILRNYLSSKGIFLPRYQKTKSVFYATATSETKKEAEE